MEIIHAVIEKEVVDCGVWFDEIPNMFAWGETVDKAKQDAVDVLNSYIETLKEESQPLPEILKNDWKIEYRFLKESNINNI